MIIATLPVNDDCVQRNRAVCSRFQHDAAHVAQPTIVNNLVFSCTMHAEFAHAASTCLTVLIRCRMYEGMRPFPRVISCAAELSFRLVGPTNRPPTLRCNSPHDRDANNKIARIWPTDRLRVTADRVPTSSRRRLLTCGVARSSPTSMADRRRD